MIMIISIMMIFLKNDHLVIMSRMALIENKFAFSIIRLINFHWKSARQHQLNNQMTHHHHSEKRLFKRVVRIRQARRTVKLGCKRNASLFCRRAQQQSFFQIGRVKVGNIYLQLIELLLYGIKPTQYRSLKVVFVYIPTPDRHVSQHRLLLAVLFTKYHIFGVPFLGRYIYPTNMFSNIYLA